MHVETNKLFANYNNRYFCHYCFQSKVITLPHISHINYEMMFFCIQRSFVIKKPLLLLHCNFYPLMFLTKYEFSNN
jgi:hypothetical protein